MPKRNRFTGGLKTIFTSARKAIAIATNRTRRVATLSEPASRPALTRAPGSLTAVTALPLRRRRDGPVHGAPLADLVSTADLHVGALLAVELGRLVAAPVHDGEVLVPGVAALREAPQCAVGGTAADGRGLERAGVDVK